jgi:molybdopterin biosynthesis enzyme
VPRVAVLSTGDEVVDASVRLLAPGQIRDANRPMLLAALSEAGAVGVDLGIVRDEAGLAGLEAAFDAAIAAGADVIISSGG